MHRQYAIVISGELFVQRMMMPVAITFSKRLMDSQTRLVTVFLPGMNVCAKQHSIRRYVLTFLETRQLMLYVPTAPNDRGATPEKITDTPKHKRVK